MEGHERHATYGGGLRQIAIVALLVGGLVLLHRFAVPPPSAGFDPTAMLALGFVVLACYAVGQLAEVGKLPHITGYLLAGILFGPSFSTFLPDAWRTAPFDNGVLNPQVIDQLGLLDTLAVALIAITAGGELKIETLRRGLRAISSILVSQLVVVVVVVTAFVWAITGGIPQLALPGAGTLATGAGIAAGVAFATIAFATSPAATIAVINGAGAEGPMSRTVLSTVVLKDVIVVVTFSIASSFAASMLGTGATGQAGLGQFLLTHILGSIAVGSILGGAVALYLRFVEQEVLLFVVGVVYAAAYVADGLHLDPVLLFLVAGFTVANFSRHGATLIHSVERLSMPVYVVFFTLAGARLHLDDLFRMAPFAFGLVLVRVAAFAVATNVGARIGRADEATRRFGWMGFVSQAGVAISLAMVLGRSLGETGQALATLLLSTIALNELFGPVMLKAAVSLARELPGQSAEDEELATPPPAEPPKEEREPKLPEWPEEQESSDPWGGRPMTTDRKLEERIYDLQADLQAIVREVSRGPLEEFRGNAELYLRELRREFLRHHRRLLVQARGDLGDADEEAEGDEPSDAEARAELATRLRAEQAELAERWRGIVLGRSARLKQSGWTPEALVESVDRLVEGLPEQVRTPWETESFVHRPDQSALKAAQRTWLHLRRGTHRTLGGEMPQRTVPLRVLARYHLSGQVPSRLEGLAALLVQSDRHLAARTRSVFEAVVRSYDELAAKLDDEEVDASKELARIRRDVEEELSLALDELGRMVGDGSRRTAAILGEGLRAVKKEIAVFGTFDLPVRKRRSSRIYRQRVRALETLTEALRRVRRSSSAGYSLLALELELVGLEARVKDALEEHVSRLESDVRGRAFVQVQRVHGALDEALRRIEEILESDKTGEQMAIELRHVAETADKVIIEAAGGASQLRDQLSRERTVAPLLDALGRAARSLTDRYEVSSHLPRGEWKLPPPSPPVEVPFRDLVTAYVDTRIAPKLLSGTRELADEVQPLATSLQELERVVAFNVELATGELEVVADETVPAETRKLLREMVAGALERSLGTVEGHESRARGWPAEVGTRLREAVLGGIEELRGQLVDGDISKTKIDALRRSAAGRRLASQAEELPGRLSRARRKARRLGRRVLGDERLARWRRVVGLPARVPSPADDASAFAPPRAREDLPLVYRRLFAPDTLEAGDLLTGRDPEIARARRVLVGESRGRLRAVALVGPDGVGKAAVSSAIVRSRAWKNVRRVNLSKPASEERVGRLFKESADNQLVVIDGLHWMVSMRPGGFEPLRRFVQGVIADGGRNAWLVHADLLFWRYASEVAPLAEAFPELVHLEPLGPTQLQSAVLARHARSGYGLTFEQDREASGVEQAIVRAASRFRRPYERYFEQLHAASGGLVRDALRLWLASIDRVDENEDFVHVGPVATSPAAALRRLPEPILVNLYLIARQGWMDADVQAWLLRVDRSTAEAQLARLAHLGLVDQVHEGVYRIAVHLRGAVVQMLHARGWVS